MTLPKRQHWLAPLILISGVLVALILVLNSGDEISSGLKKHPLSVEIVKAKAENLRADISAWGLVEPRETITIRPQVKGIVTSVDDDIVAGAFVKKESLLFTIDSRDYENIYAETTAIYEQAKQLLEIEKGQQKIARAEYKLLSKNGGGVKNKTLALREPQLKERKAALAITKAQQDRAKLDLERTTLLSPCDGQVLSEAIAEGQYMDIGKSALELACTDQYHILVSFSPHQEPDLGANEVLVEINGKTHSARLVTILPQINPETRHKQALVTLDSVTVPLGAYVSVMLKSKIMHDVIALPKAALRANNSLWVLTKQNTLDIRSIKLAAENDKQIFIESGLEDGAHVIISHIATPLKGMKLRLIDVEQYQNSVVKNSVGDFKWPNF